MQRKQPQLKTSHFKLEDQDKDMESFFKNPGFLHIGEKILKNLDFKNQVSCRLVQKSWKNVLDKQASKVRLEELLQILQKELLIPHKQLHHPLDIVNNDCKL